MTSKVQEEIVEKRNKEIEKEIKRIKHGLPKEPKFLKEKLENY